MAVADLDADNFVFAIWQYGDEGDNTLVGDLNELHNIDGLGGDDSIQGGSWDDHLRGDEGDDRLSGGYGNDTLEGGEGDDTLAGEENADIFKFAAGHGNDTITDFGDRGDLIDLTAITDITGIDDLTITADGTTAVIDLTAHGGGTIRLENVAVADLDAADFTFHEAPADVGVEGI